MCMQVKVKVHISFYCSINFCFYYYALMINESQAHENLSHVILMLFKTYHICLLLQNITNMNITQEVTDGQVVRAGVSVI